MKLIIWKLVFPASHFNNVLLLQMRILTKPQHLGQVNIQSEKHQDNTKSLIYGLTHPNGESKLLLLMSETQIIHFPCCGRQTQMVYD